MSRLLKGVVQNGRFDLLVNTVLQVGLAPALVQKRFNAAILNSGLVANGMDGSPSNSAG